MEGIHNRFYRAVKRHRAELDFRGRLQTMHQKEAITDLVAEILDGTQINLKVDSYDLHEDLETRCVKIHCAVHHVTSGEKQVIEERQTRCCGCFRQTW